MTRKKIQPSIALLTSCSVTRTRNTIVNIEDAPEGTMGTVLDWWAKQLSKHKDEMVSPGDLYAGVGFQTITEIAQDLGHENIFVVTGGQGLINLTEEIVPYDFTSDKGAEHNVTTHIVGERFIPHVWWGLINQKLRGTPCPVANLLAQYDVVVAALPKAFIKYIISDLGSLGRDDLRDRVFIPTPMSFLSSFPMNLREAFVPYDVDYLLDVPASRYNKAQCVARKFITGARNSKLHITDYTQELVHECIQRVASDDQGETNFQEIFDAHPELLEAATPNEAARRAKLLGFSIGGKQRWAGAWYGAKGFIEGKLTVPKDVAEQSAAVMAKVMANSKSGEGTTSTDDILYLGTFVSTLKSMDLEACFSATDVAAWAKEMYPNNKHLCSVQRVGYTLEYYAKYLGVEALGKRQYKILPPQE